MITVKYQGGLGNMLFQYCFGRMLATRLGYKLNASHINGFSSTKNLINGESYSDNKITLTEQTVDVDTLVNNRPKSHIICDGYFQRLSYYEKYYSDIKNNWLVLDNKYCKEKKNSNDVILHIRRGDFLIRGRHINCPSFSFYQRILEHYVKDWNDLYICTDSPNDPFFGNFKIYNPIMYSSEIASPPWPPSEQITQGTLDDFSFIMSFNRIVLSVSTFSWWASYLSDASEIYYPILGNFDEKNKHIDLVSKERRSIFCEPFGDMA